MSKHFKLEEFTRSYTADKNNIDNTPNENQIKNIENLIDNVLEPLRERGGGPLIITSGFRSKALNDKVGGVKNSQHLAGRAADVQPQKCDKFMVAKLFNLAVEMDKQGIISCDQIIIESKSMYNIYGLHISSKIDKEHNRHEYFAIQK